MRKMEPRVTYTAVAELAWSHEGSASEKKTMVLLLEMSTFGSVQGVGSIALTYENANMIV